VGYFVFDVNGIGRENDTKCRKGPRCFGNRHSLKYLRSVWSPSTSSEGRHEHFDQLNQSINQAEERMMTRKLKQNRRS
jgi:hypothetical protein